MIFLEEYEAGIEDAEVLEIAVQENAVIITNDKDFGELVFRHGKNSKGVILLRLYDLKLAERIELTVKAIREHEAEIEDAFTVISESSVRIRKRY
ncbi:MAG: DUF5615 family PIN-like protein [Pyrinomonadaceae bacterium]|nr:DUF5615 family PIN-like protein [Pyrinomonadaceae bacterium]